MKNSHVLKGKIIQAIDLADDCQSIRFICVGGEKIIAKCDGKCCSRTWIEDILDPEAAVGVVVVRAVDIDLPSHLQKPTTTSYSEEKMQFYGFAVETVKGRCTISYRNSSNGYYGGNLVWPGGYFYGGVDGQNKSTQHWRSVVIAGKKQ